MIKKFKKVSALLLCAMIIQSTASTAMVSAATVDNSANVSAAVNVQSVSANATSAKCGDNLKWSLNSSTGTLTITGSGDMYNYSWSNYAPWYNLRKSIKAVVLPDGITSIGEDAFFYCSNLTEITIPSNVNNIASYAFQGCSSLTEITIPSNVTNIGDSAFSSCSSLTEITIPSNVTNIGDSAFYYCTGLTDITISSGVTKIGNSAFSYCKGLTNITIPDSVTELGKYVFNDCISLESVQLSKNITKIPEDAFAHCENLKSITIPDSVTYIESYAFICCTSLTNIVIPDSVESVGYGAFEGCTNLSTVSIGKNLKMFYSDEDSYGYYYNNVFSGCDKITKFTVASGNPYLSASNYNLYNKDKTVLIKYAGGRTTTSFTVPTTVNRISEYAFSGAENLKTVKIPNSVTEISYNCFANCTNLTTVTLPDSLKTINDSVFFGCSSLASITIPKNVESIYGGSAFYGCNALENVTILNPMLDFKNQGIFGYDNENVTIYSYQYSSAEKYAKESNYKFVALEGKPDYSEIACTDTASWSFDPDTKTLTISGTGELPDYSFDTASGYHMITMPWYCVYDYIENVVISEGITRVGQCSFAYCSSLKNVSLPNTLNSIGYDAFYNTGLSEIVIPASVTDIDYYAIYTYDYYFDEEGNYVNRKITIYGYEGSAAEQYCKDHSYNTIFVSIGDMPPTTVPVTTAKPTTVPVTTVKPTTAPVTTVKPTTAPVTTAKPTTEPATIAEPTTEYTGRILIGDVNLNNKINVNDATEIQSYLAELTTLSATALKAADTDQDMNVNIKDATNIQKYLLEFENCGYVGCYEDEIQKPTQPVTTPVTVPTTEKPTNPTEEPTEQPTEPISATKIYFKNNNNWSSVNAYYWSDADKNMTVWPGKAMENEGNGVYSLEVPESAKYVIFSNNGGSQTADLTIPGLGQIYDGSKWSVYDVKPTTPPVTVPTEPVSSSKIYFKNNSNWSSVNAYYWSDSDENMTVWPGKAMTNEGNGVYSLEVPSSAKYVIFSNNGGSQTADLTIPAFGQIYDGSKWSEYKAAPVDPTDPTSSTKVYFQNTGNWATVNAYYWSEANKTMTTWPGKVMKNEGNGVYSIDLPKGAEYVIFNNGAGAQTADLKIPAFGQIYNNSTNSWSAYKG